MLKTVEGELPPKEIEKKNFKPVYLRRGVDIDEETYSGIMAKAMAKLNPSQHHTLFGDGKTLPVVLERLEDGKMRFVGIPTDMQGLIRIGKMPPVKAISPDHPSVTSYSIRYIVPDDDAKGKVLRAIEEVSQIKMPVVADRFILDDTEMKLVGGEWIGDSKEVGKLRRYMVNVEKEGVIKTDFGIYKRSWGGEHTETELLAVRYTLSYKLGATAKIVKVELKTASGVYMPVMNEEIKEEMMKLSNEGGTARKEFPSDGGKLAIDYTFTQGNKLLKMGLVGLGDTESLRLMKFERDITEFLSHKNVQEWYAKTAAGRRVDEEHLSKFMLHTAEESEEGMVMKLKEPANFAGHKILSFTLSSRVTKDGEEKYAVRTQTGPFRIAIDKDGVSVIGSKEDENTGKTVAWMAQYREHWMRFYAGDPNQLASTLVQVRDGKLYVKMPSTIKPKSFKEAIGGIEKGGFVSIEEAKRISEDKELEGDSRKASFIVTQLRQIVQYEREMEEALRLENDAKKLLQGHYLGRAVRKFKIESAKLAREQS